MTENLHVVDHPLDRVVQIANGKGGVGKTSLAANIAIEAARDGLDVLLVDLDPQGNLAEDLGYGLADWDDDGANLADALIAGEDLQPHPTGRKGLDVVCGGAELRRAERHLVVDSSITFDETVDATHNNGRAYQALAYPLAQVAPNYDLIVLDSPPGFECLLHSALGAARWLVVPAREDDSSLKGLSRISKDFTEAVLASSRVDFLAVVLFGTLTTATKNRANAEEQLREMVPATTRMCETMVRASASATAARYLGLSISELAEAVAALPPYHEQIAAKGRSARKPTLDDLPLPDTAALSSIKPDKVLKVLNSAGKGNLARLAQDYDDLTEELFDAISAREAAASSASREEVVL